MAFVFKNPLTQGLSGMLGGMLVFRRVGNKTVVAVAAAKGYARSTLQLEQQGRFAQAMAYAKRQMQDPALKDAYLHAARRRGLPSAFNTAVADYFHGPEITAVGVQEGVLHIQAVDDFMVARVRVQLLDAAGEVAAVGDAEPLSGALEWVYGLPAGVPVAKVVITATDLAGNEVVKEIAFADQ